MVVIIDYGVGNLASIKNMLKKSGTDAVISSDEKIIQNASKFILPGVGSFDHGISNLKSASYFTCFENKVLIQKTPVLGVCLGAQLLGSSSEEGTLNGLGWIKAKVVRFNEEKIHSHGLKIPHMGWSEVVLKKDSSLFKNMFSDPRFYFVHSYHLICAHSNDESLTADYGYQFTAGVEVGNILGVQFHPEKSHKYGLKLYENFIKYY